MEESAGVKSNDKRPKFMLALNSCTKFSAVRVCWNTIPNLFGEMLGNQLTTNDDFIAIREWEPHEMSSQHTHILKRRSVRRKPNRSKWLVVTLGKCHIAASIWCFSSPAQEHFMMISSAIWTDKHCGRTCSWSTFSLHFCTRVIYTLGLVETLLLLGDCPSLMSLNQFSENWALNNKYKHQHTIHTWGSHSKSALPYLSNGNDKIK